MNIIIRPAKETESSILTDISIKSKRYWNYPDSYFDIWKDELTITPTYINTNKIFVAEYENEAIGYFSIVHVKDDFCAGKVFVQNGYWLEHIFVLPQYIGRGIGTKLIEFAKDYCKNNNIDSLKIFSDPNAKGFYEKLGAVYKGESLSSIEGRTVSLFEFLYDFSN